MPAAPLDTKGVVGWRSFPAQTLLLVEGVSGQECMNMAFVMGVHIGFCAATCAFNAKWQNDDKFYIYMRAHVSGRILCGHTRARNEFNNSCILRDLRKQLPPAATRALV